MIDNLRHVRSFIALARIGNFTRAAVELRMSQSALTVQIKQLEGDIGATLFDRGKRRISLTQAGQDIYAPLERLLVDAEGIVGRTRDLAGLRRGIVSMAVLPSLASHLIPLAIQSFTSQHPGVIVQVRDLVGDRIIEAVKREEVDFGIGSHVTNETELKSTLLMVDRLSAFVPEYHPLAQERFVTLTQLKDYPLVLTGRDTSVREIVQAAFKKDSFILQPAYEVNNMSTALGLVAANLGVAILPETATSSEPEASIRKVAIRKPELSRRIELLQRRDKALSPAGQKMIAVFRELVRPQGARTRKKAS